MSTKKRSPERNAFVSPILCAMVVFVVWGLADINRANAQVQAFPNTPDLQITAHALRQRAAPDECWAYLDMELPSPLPMWTDPTNCEQYGTTPPAKPKVNQSYIWGLTEAGDSIWFGTFANGNCVTQAGSIAGSTNPNGAPNAHATDSWVCEYYKSPYFPVLYPDARIGDARTPRIYEFIKSTSTLVDRTPKFSEYIDNPPVRNPEGIFPPLIRLRGIRAAATYNNVVVLAGPTLSVTGGITFFGFNATSGEFLGGYSVLGYNNIRQFLNLNGTLYTAVGTNDAIGKITGGAILRVNPSIVPDCTFNPSQPFPCFLMNGGVNTAPTPPTVVGTLATVAGVITEHQGRIFTATWPSQDLPGSQSTLYMSPVVPPAGLTTANATQWTALWQAGDYEPDAGMTPFYAGGGIASFDGYLWWGTLHIPMSPFLYLLDKYPPTTQEEAIQDIVGTLRSTVLFRGKDFDTNPKIDIVYGNYELPVFTPPAAPGEPGTWQLRVNNMNKKSLWGPSGFGNLWNNYSWSASVWNNRLWFGTMDWSFTAQQSEPIFEEASGVSFPPNLFDTATFGADLFYFTSADKPGFPESTNGVDNPTTYGIRNQIRSTNGNLFMGTANPMNLLTDPADPKGFGGLGGWELRELSLLPDLNTPVGSSVVVNLPTGVSVTYCSVTNAGTTVSKIVPNPFRSKERFLPLLRPYDLNGPESNGIAGQPTAVALVWSSALWGQGCGSAALASVTIPYSADVITPRLVQLQWDGTEYVWINITTSIDPIGLKISGEITNSSLGIFAVAPAIPPTLGGNITNQGVDPEKASYYVDLTISNDSHIHAKNIKIEQLSFSTLIGTGDVTYNTAIGPPFPLSVPDLAPGNSAVVRLYIRSTTPFGTEGVRRFLMTDTLRLSDGVGTEYVMDLDQSIIAVNSVLFPSLAANVTNQGVDPDKASYYADLTISNMSQINLKNIKMEQLQFSTLIGTGIVTYNLAVGPPFPLSVPDLAAGNSTVVRLYLKSTTAFGTNGVRRFLMTDTLRFNDGVGTEYVMDMDQSVIAVDAATPIPSLGANITSQGVDADKASYYADLRIQNTSQINLKNIKIEQLHFSTLIGTGVVNYNSSVGPALPLSVSDLAPGDSAVVRLYLRSTTTFGSAGVRRFLMVDTIRLTDGVGTEYVMDMDQSVIAVDAAFTPSFAANVTSQGVDSVKASYYADLTIQNTSQINLKNIKIEQLHFSTLIGTGVVTYNSSAGPALPLSVPDLAPGNSAVVRLYLQSTTTFGNAAGVRRFLMVETIRLRDGNGTEYVMDLDQSVIAVNSGPLPQRR